MEAFKLYANELIKSKTTPNFVKLNFKNGVVGYEAKKTFKDGIRIIPREINSMEDIISTVSMGDLICGLIIYKNKEGKKGLSMNVGIAKYKGVYAERTIMIDKSASTRLFIDIDKVFSCQLFVWELTEKIDTENFDPMKEEIKLN
jgi:hypothetical protein